MSKESLGWAPALTAGGLVLTAILAVGYWMNDSLNTKIDMLRNDIDETRARIDGDRGTGAHVVGPTKYGAVACGRASAKCGWITNSKSSEVARLKALEICGQDDCRVMAGFTRCGAVAARYIPGKGSPVRMNAGVGDTEAEASLNALQTCMAGGDERCEVMQSLCNGKSIPGSSSTGSQAPT